MFADRAYSPGFFASTDRVASLLYFTAAVPAIGFVHGPGDANPLNDTMLEGYAENRSMNTGRDSIRSLQSNATR
jgi:hypothetical protein